MLLKAESPRDYADLLLSWAHMPNVVICDSPSGLARHVNLRAPESIPFTPHEGSLAAPTAENIKRGNEGSLQVNLTWLTEKKNPPDLYSHPLTGSSEHYALSKNDLGKTSKDPTNVLRHIDLVPELSGRLNMQVVEQFFAQMKKSDYFLNMALPSTNIFLLRNILHHRNVRLNKAATEKIQKTFGEEVMLNEDGHTVRGL